MCGYRAIYGICVELFGYVYIWEILDTLGYMGRYGEVGDVCGYI